MFVVFGMPNKIENKYTETKMKLFFFLSKIPLATTQNKQQNNFLKKKMHKNIIIIKTIFLSYG